MKRKIMDCYDKNDLDEFLVLFKENCSKLMRTKDDYINKSVSIHNMTMKDTEKIFLHMMKDIKKRKKYIYALFQEEENIKFLIACYCLRYGIYKIKSRKILREISKNTQNPLLKFSTEIALKEYNLLYKGEFKEED